MNNYELTIVISSKLEDEERAAALAKVQEFITRFGGTVTEVKPEEKKTLAYEIQKMNEAFYSFILFEAAADVPATLEKELRIMEPVIRYLCVRTDRA